MASPATTCDHNATAQTLKPGVPVPCRQCGAYIQPSPRAGQVPSQQDINATYPGTVPNPSAWPLNQ